MKEREKFLLRSSPRLSARLGSAWKFLLPRHRHSDPQMEQRSNDLPESGRRPRYNQIRKWKQLRSWPNAQANKPKFGCVDWTLQKSWQYVLLDRWHSVSGPVFFIEHWPAWPILWKVCSHIRRIRQTWEMEWPKMQFARGTKTHSPCCTLPEETSLRWKSQAF